MVAQEDAPHAMTVDEWRELERCGKTILKATYKLNGAAWIGKENSLCALASFLISTAI